MIYEDVYFFFFNDTATTEIYTLSLHDALPISTFCSPNVGSFGLTEQQARDAGHDVVVGKLQYGAVGAGTVYGDRQGLVKVVGDKKYGELLGGHIVGTRATELIQDRKSTRLNSSHANISYAVFCL